MMKMQSVEDGTGQMRSEMIISKGEEVRIRNLNLKIRAFHFTISVLEEAERARDWQL